MQTVFGNSGAMGAQVVVAPGRPIAADNLIFGARVANLRGQVDKKIENLWRIMVNFASPVIPQKMIELSERFRQILIAAAVDDVDAFARVRVK